MAAAKPDHQRVSRREREIMNALFALKIPASAGDIRSRIADPPSYSAIRVMLARLEKKELVQHTQEGSRYLYSATVSRTTAQRTALQQYLHTFFGGSLTRMATALVKQAPWTADELDELQGQIERMRKGKKR